MSAENPTLAEFIMYGIVPKKPLVLTPRRGWKCLRYDQIEKRRKTTRRANRLRYKRYRRKHDA